MVHTDGVQWSPPVYGKDGGCVRAHLLLCCRKPATDPFGVCLTPDNRVFVCDSRGGRVGNPEHRSEGEARQEAERFQCLRRHAAGT